DGIQQQMLDDLKPKRLEFADALPQKQVSPQAMVDTDQFRTQRSLDLLPEGVGPGQAEDAAEFIERSDMLPGPGEDSGLSASDDGRLDMDGEGLRRKPGALEARRGAKGPKPKPAPRKQPKEQLSPEEQKRLKREREAAEKERERRFAEA